MGITGSESATSKSASEEARVGTLGLLEGRSERIVSGFGEEAVSLNQNRAKIQGSMRNVMLGEMLLVSTK